MRAFVAALILLLPLHALGGLLDVTHKVTEPTKQSDGEDLNQLIRCNLTVSDQTGTIKTREFLATTPQGGGVHEWTFRDTFPEVVGVASATAVCTNPVGDSEVSNTLEVTFPVKDTMVPMAPILE